VLNKQGKFGGDNNIYGLHYTDIAIFWYLGLCFGRILKKMKSGMP